MSQKPPWSTLGISKTTFYRQKRHLETNLDLKGLKDYIYSGLYIKPWSEKYFKEISRLLKEYFQTHSIVTEESVAKWINSLPPLQHSYRNWRHRACSAYARYLYRYYKSLPKSEYEAIVSLYPRKPVGYRPRQLVISSAQYTELQEVATSKQRQIVVLLGETGLRLSELANLTLRYCHLSNDPTKSYAEVIRGKGDVDRFVPLSKKAQIAIREYGQWPNNFSSLESRLKRLRQKSGIELTAHSFRHYRITQWANNPKISLTTTQKWAGHSDIKTTMGYVHVTDEEAMRAAFE